MNSLRYLEAMHLKTEAQKDDIKVSLLIIDGKLVYGIGRYGHYDTFHGALAHVKFLQSHITRTPFNSANATGE